MVTLNGYTTTPHHRQNRRRERPGSRTRRTITRKANIQTEYTEGILDALDTSVPLPSDKSRPSPLMRQNFDQSWQRWKARQAEEKALAEMDMMQLEQEQQRLLFGGEIDDDALIRMGILYNEGDNQQSDLETSKTSFEVIPVEHSAPLFILRQGKSRRNRRLKSRSLSLYLSLSNLRDDLDIARFLSPSTLHTNTPMIQHCNESSSTNSTIDIPDIPLSLPTTLALRSPTSAYGSNLVINDTIPLILPHSLDSGDWTFIDSVSHTPKLDSPDSEPETWILLDDS